MLERVCVWSFLIFDVLVFFFISILSVLPFYLFTSWNDSELWGVCVCVFVFFSSKASPGRWFGWVVCVVLGNFSVHLCVVVCNLPICIAKRAQQNHRALAHQYNAWAASTHNQFMSKTMRDDNDDHWPNDFSVCVKLYPHVCMRAYT